MANVPQRRLEADKRSKRADKKYTASINDATRRELMARRMYDMNPSRDNEQFANEAADEASFLESSRAKEGGYDEVLNPRKKGTGYFKKGGSVSASKRADGCAVKGKTKGRMV